MTNRLWRKPKTNKQKYRPQPPRMYDLNSQTEKRERDRHIYDDDLKIQTTNINEIYPELTAFGEVGATYQIEINRGE